VSTTHVIAATQYGIDIFWHWTLY